MYGRLSRYSFRVENEQRWADAERQPEPPSVVLLAALDGFRGVWYLRSERAAGSADLVEVIFSLWDTREQAEAVRSLLGEKLARLFDEVGVSLAKPPDADVFAVVGGHMWEPGASPIT